jgi:hypothetical protein
MMLERAAMAVAADAMITTHDADDLIAAPYSYTAYSAP